MYNDKNLAYLREALAYLTTIQKYFIESDGTFITDTKIKVWENFPKLRSILAAGGVLQIRDILFLQIYGLDFNQDELQRYKENFFTKYEDFFTVALLADANLKIRKAYHTLDLPLPPPTLIGTLPIGNLNARVFKSPQQINIITINSGLISFVYSIAKVIAFSYQYVRNEKDLIELSLNDTPPEQLEHFQALSQDFLYSLDTYLKHGYVPDSLNDIALYQDSHLMGPIKGLVKSSLLFVIGHEYAHISLAASNQQTLQSQYDSAFNFAQNMEIDSDFLGFLLAMYAEERDTTMKPFFRYAGIEFYLMLCEFLEDILQIKLSETHPMATDRITKMRAYGEELIPDEFDYSMKLAKRNKTLIYSFWREVKGELVEEIEEIIRKGFTV